MPSMLQRLLLLSAVSSFALSVTSVGAQTQPQPVSPKEHPANAKRTLPADVIAPRGGKAFHILEPISIQTPRTQHIPAFPERGWNGDSKNTDELVHTFKADLRRQIRRHWSNPPAHFAKAVVQFTLLPDGKVEDVKIVQSSNAKVDKLAIDAIEKGAPYAYLPKWIKKPVAMKMTFDERMSSGFEDAVNAIEVTEQPGKRVK